MHIAFTCRDLILARAVAHYVSGCPLLVALAAEAHVWRCAGRKRRYVSAERWLDLVSAEIDNLSRR
jgi:hypothetical protein